MAHAREALSPLLHILTMEQLAMALRSNYDISGLHISSHHVKLALLANDLLIYITNPHISLLSIVSEFQQFVYLVISRWTIKTKILNVCLSRQDLKLLWQNFPFKICKEFFKFLGIQVPSDLSQLFHLNFHPHQCMSRIDLHVLPWLSSDLRPPMHSLPWITTGFYNFGKNASPN